MLSPYIVYKFKFFGQGVYCSEEAWPQICGAQEFHGLVVLIPLIPSERGNHTEALRKWVSYRGRSLCGYCCYTSHLQYCTGEENNWG